MCQEQIYTNFWIGPMIFILYMVLTTGIIRATEAIRIEQAQQVRSLLSD